MRGGARTWYFPDGYLPAPSQHGSMEAHEALMLLNTKKRTVEVVLDIYYSDREPQKDIRISVRPESVKTLRLDNPEDIGDVEIPPLTQYALRVRAKAPIIAQFGRLDTTQNNMAYYGTSGYWEA
jgi:hypothetical protein